MKRILNYIYKSPLLYSILIIISIATMSAILSVGLLTAPGTISFSISTFLIVVITKNIKIYTTKNFFKTLKVSLPYILLCIIAIVILTFNVTQNEQPIKTTQKHIFINIIANLMISFMTESMIIGLCANKFAQKYIDKKNGFLKTTIFPTIIFGTMIFVSMNAYVNTSVALFESLDAIILHMLFIAIYLNGRNIYPIILAQLLTICLINFNCIFVDNSIEEKDMVKNITIDTQYIAKSIFKYSIFLIYFLVLLKKHNKNNFKISNKL